MSNYIIYTTEYTNYVIVEYFNPESTLEWHNVEAELITLGYVILDVCGKYIKCEYMEKEESRNE